MSRPDITDERVLELIEAYGASPMAWPEDERSAAEARLSANRDRFAGALETARALDSLFEADELPAPPQGLAGRILEAAPQPRQKTQPLLGGLVRLIIPQGRRWPASAALASLVMGLFAGYTASATSPAPGYENEAESIVYAALGYDEFEALIEEEGSYE